MEYYDLIAKRINDYPKAEVPLQDGLMHNEYLTLKKVDYYYASKFISKRKDGFKRFFLNIVKNRTQAATKAIDIDTKHTKVHAKEGASYEKAAIFREELIDFMKKEGFAELFNRMADKYPRYGSVIVKNVDGVPELSLLRNLVRDTSVIIDKSPYVFEKFVYTIDEFREEGKKKGWDNIEETIDIYSKADKDMIQVVEGYLYMEGKYVEEAKDDDYIKSRVVLSGVEFHNDKKMAGKGCKITELIKPEIFEDNLYQELQWDEEEGRGLGVGIVEDLFQNQEGWNEAYNMERQGLYWSSKILFQSRDQNIPSNLFVKVKNGTVFQTKDEINVVDTRSRALPDYQALFQRLEKNSDERSFNYEINTGESLPSGTPFRLGALLSNAVNSYFDFKREKFGLFIKKIINDFVIPEFKKSNNKSHIVRFNGEKEQLTQLQETFAKVAVVEAMNEYKKQTGKKPSLEEFDMEYDRIFQRVTKKKELFFEVADGFYDDIESEVDIIITGESKDVQSELTTLTTVWQILMQRGDPRAENILDMIINLTGKDPKGLLGVSVPNNPTAGLIPDQAGGNTVGDMAENIANNNQSNNLPSNL